MKFPITVKWLPTWKLQAPDMNDFVLLVGLGLIGYGLFLINLSLALIIVGLFLMASGWLGARNKALMSAFRSIRDLSPEQRKALLESMTPEEHRAFLLSRRKNTEVDPV